MKRISLITLMIVLAMSHVAFAGMEAGNKEIQIQGAISKYTNSEDDDTSSTTSIQLTFNYFFTSNISIGGTWWGNSTVYEYESGNENESTNNFLLLRGDFYLGSATSKAVPYIGVHGGQNSYTSKSTSAYGTYEDSGSTSAVGWHGGLKIFATENTSWNFEINSTTYTPEVEPGQPEIDETTTQFLLGFSYYF